MEEKKLNPFVRIKGNAHRGKEVIEELERRGGKNNVPLNGTDDKWYFIEMNGNIDCIQSSDDATDFFLSNYEEIDLSTRWRAKAGEEYWYLFKEGGYYFPDKSTECLSHLDDGLWNRGNYFSSESEAQEEADAINAKLRGDNKL